MNRLIDRFWSCVDKSGDCWLWTNGKNTLGYGVVWNGARAILAHRHAWTIVRGPIPPGMLVLHRCDNPPCVNPEHLYVGTSSDNARDRSARRRYRDDRGSRHPSAKLTETAVLEIRRQLSAGRKPSELAAAHGVTPQMIQRINTRRAWRHI